MRIIKLSILFFLLLPLFGTAQELGNIDSLELELEKSKLSFEEKSKLFFKLSLIHHDQENFPTAINFKLKELNLYSQYEYDSSVAHCEERLGMMYYRIGSYDVASQYFLKALTYFENNSSPLMSAQITGNLANVYTRLENYNKALEYLLISKNILSQKVFFNTRTMAGLYINIGLAYEGAKTLDSAMYYYNKAVNLISEEENPLYMATAFNNIGEVDFAMGEFDDAMSNYQKANYLFRQINNKNGIGSTLSNMAKVSIKTGDHKQAILLCYDALEYFHEINALFFIVDTEKQLNEAYKGLGDYKNSVIHLELYLKYKDSLKGNETLEYIANLEMQHATQKEQQKFIMLEQEALLAEKEHKLKQMWLYILIGGFFVLLIVTLLVIIYMRGSLQRNKLKQQILKQQQKQLHSELVFKQKEAENFATYIQEKNSLLSNLKKEIKSIVKLTDHKGSELNKLTNLVTQSLHADNDRKELELKIDQTHQEFVNRLKSKHPKLTKTETRLCSLLLLELSSKEIATVMNIETASVKTGRNRLRKKLNLPPQTDLKEALNMI